MEIKEFIERFAEIFDDVDVATLTPQTEFHNLDEWSSLSALGLIAMTDEEFDVELKGEEIRSARTINDLFTLILSKV
ncbi:acyl carrier protein [Odoribacter lunatus]|uniref:acyl carrier protein n=1 Tax=Odoribacter lunatus TaxID=2941335 RepID=UPI002041194D|nr:acyl carrier protein [Odoribacter lunatus]